jgi:ribonuclease HI
MVSEKSPHQSLSISNFSGEIMLSVFADGLCEPRNPGGFACWAWVAFDNSGQETANNHGCIGSGQGMTNNLAEYHAVLEAFRFASKDLFHKPIQFFTDSQLVVNQVNGEWACNSPSLQPLCVEASEWLNRTDWTLGWIPRAQNVRADQLTRIAYREACMQKRPVG